MTSQKSGALDYQTGKRILKILQNMSRKNGSTVLIVTHNAAIAPIADKKLFVFMMVVPQHIKINKKPADISNNPMVGE